MANTYITDLTAVSTGDVVSSPDRNARDVEIVSAFGILPAAAPVNKGFSEPFSIEPSTLDDHPVNEVDILSFSSSFLSASEASRDAAAIAKTSAEDWASRPEDDPVPVVSGGDGVTTFSALHGKAKVSAATGKVPVSSGDTSDSLADKAWVARVNGTDDIDHVWLDLSDDSFNFVSGGAFKGVASGTLPATDFTEGGVALASKYLGLTTQAADSNRLEGHAASSFVVANRSGSGFSTAAAVLGNSATITCTTALIAAGPVAIDVDVLTEAPVGYSLMTVYLYAAGAGPEFYENSKFIIKPLTADVSFDGYSEYVTPHAVNLSFAFVGAPTKTEVSVKVRAYCKGLVGTSYQLLMYAPSTSGAISFKSGSIIVTPLAEVAV